MIQWIPSLVYLALGLGLCAAGKAALGRRLGVDDELFRRDNAAVGLPVGAFYLAVLIALGGPLSASSSGSLLRDALGTLAWGAAALASILAGEWIARRTLFAGIELESELKKGNLSAGLVAAGSHAANGMVTLGAFAGDGGGALPAFVFWLYGQIWLAFAAKTLPLIMRAKLSHELRRDNRAAALAFTGALLGAGNIVRIAVGGAFEGWSVGVAEATTYAASGLALQFLVAELADRALLPGATLRSELVESPKPAVGAVLALFHLGASILVGWAL